MSSVACEVDVTAGIGVTVVPVTLLTTLADHAALAYARGRHPLHPQSIPLREALAARDALFVKHVTSLPNAWSPSALRATVPSALAAIEMVSLFKALE